MERESEPLAWERLSKNDREILGRPEPRAVLLGVKPASFEDWHGDIEDPAAVNEYLRSKGIDAIVTRHMIVNVPAVDRRIREERELAREAGWKNGMDARELVDRYQHAGPEERLDALRGFLLGFPASAIRGFARREELSKKGVPWDIRKFFSTAEHARLFSVVTDKRGRSLIEQMAKDADAIPKRSWGVGPDRPDPADEQALYDRYRPAIEDLYRRYWRLSKDDAEALAWTEGVYLTDPKSGDAAFSFVVFGKDGAERDDVAELRRRYAEAVKKDQKAKQMR